VGGFAGNIAASTKGCRTGAGHARQSTLKDEGVEEPLIREGLNEEREVSVEEDRYVLSLACASTATSATAVTQSLCPWARVLIVEPCEAHVPGGNRDDMYLVRFLRPGAS
jgi:hypothetical protein